MRTTGPMLVLIALCLVGAGFFLGLLAEALQPQSPFTLFKVQPVGNQGKVIWAATPPAWDEQDKLWRFQTRHGTAAAVGGAVVIERVFDAQVSE